MEERENDKRKAEVRERETNTRRKFEGRKYERQRKEKKKRRKEIRKYREKFSVKEKCCKPNRLSRHDKKKRIGEWHGEKSHEIFLNLCFPFCPRVKKEGKKCSNIFFFFEDAKQK